LSLFRSRTFSSVNIVTFVIYAALAGVFFFVVINLQVVAGFSPLTAGLSLLPVTVLMLLLSARAGALAARIGPRIPMTVGPLVCGVALVLLSRIGADASYVVDVLPAVVVLGLGLSLTVAPLTSTALAAAQDRDAGVASGVNNAVARTAGLLAIAVLPVVSGVGSSLTDPQTMAPAYKTSMLICAGLVTAGGLIALVTIPSSYAAVRQQSDLPVGPRAAPEEPSTPVRMHCAIGAPPLHPGTTAK
jgi:predicted MFS family arabinose efflux permease